MTDTHTLHQADLIEKWLDKLDFDFKVSDVSMLNIFSNRWRVDVHAPSTCPFNLNKPIKASFYLLVTETEVIDKTVR